MKKHVIYIHSDPLTGFIRYVGRSSSGLRRAQSHFKSKKSLSRSPHHCWIGSLRKKSLEPVVEILESFDPTDDVHFLLNEAERFWISYFRMIGCPLLNVTDGGDDFPIMSGSKNFMFGKKNQWGNHTTEAIEKIRVSQLGKKFSQEHRDRIKIARAKQPPANKKHVLCIETNERFEMIKDVLSKHSLTYKEFHKLVPQKFRIIS